MQQNPHFSGGFKLTEPNKIRAFFFLCWLTYFSTYLGRLNFTACLAQMVDSGDFSRTSVGLAGSAFFFAYGVFQLVFGVLGDRWNPRKLVFFGVFCSGCLNLIMSVATHPEAIVLLWMCNGMVQAAVWSPMLRLTVDVLPPEQGVNASIRYSTTLPFGTFAAYLISAAAIAAVSWRAAFAVAGFFLFAISFLWLRGIKRICGESGEARHESRKSALSLRAVLGGLPKGVLWVLAAAAAGAVLHGLLKDSLQTWMPSMLGECFQLPPVASIVITLVIPIVNLGGVYVGKWANDKLFRNELKTSCAAFLLSALLFVLLRFCLSLFVVSVSVFALCAALMLSVNTMLVTLVPLRLREYGCVSTLSGALNAATYLGSTLSVYGVSILLESGGWQITAWVWAAVAVCGALVCGLVSHRWKKVR